MVAAEVMARVLGQRGKGARGKLSPKKGGRHPSAASCAQPSHTRQQGMANTCEVAWSALGLFTCPSFMARSAACRALRGGGAVGGFLVPH